MQKRYVGFKLISKIPSGYEIMRYEIDKTLWSRLNDIINEALSHLAINCGKANPRTESNIVSFDR